MEVSYGRGYVYSIQYHIVWCVKYRHQILNQDIEERLIEILTEIADNEGFKILEYNTDMDHIHLLINCISWFPLIATISTTINCSSTSN